MAHTDHRKVERGYPVGQRALAQPRPHLVGHRRVAIGQQGQTEIARRVRVAALPDRQVVEGDDQVAMTRQVLGEAVPRMAGYLQVPVPLVVRTSGQTDQDRLGHERLRRQKQPPGLRQRLAALDSLTHVERQR
jgi:hypothetical protein